MGTWEGVLTRTYEGVVTTNGLVSTNWRFVIKGRDVRLFSYRENVLTEIKPGKHQMLSQSPNGLIISIDSGDDPDGMWTETQSYLLLLKSPNTLSVLCARAISNSHLPETDPNKAFFIVTRGDFKRGDPSAK